MSKVTIRWKGGNDQHLPYIGVFNDGDEKEVDEEKANELIENNKADLVVVEVLPEGES